MTRTTAATTTTVTVDLIDVITVTADPTAATMTGTAVTIAATIAAMTTMMNDMMNDAMTITATIAAKTTEMTGMMIAVMTGVMIITAKTTTIATTTIARSLLQHHHHQKGETPMVCFRPPTAKSNSSLVFAKQPRATNNINQTQGRSAKSTLNLHNLCIGQSNQSLSPGKTVGCTYHWVINPIVDIAFLPKTLIDGGNSLNIIFTKTLRKIMDFVFNKMTACNEVFYGMVPNKDAYPIGRVCLPVTFGTKETSAQST
jgi:hypothetical protein